MQRQKDQDPEGTRSKRRNKISDLMRASWDTLKTLSFNVQRSDNKVAQK